MINPSSSSSITTEFDLDLYTYGVSFNYELVYEKSSQIKQSNLL